METLKERIKKLMDSPLRDINDRDMKEFMKRNGGAAWIATTLCDRCKREYESEEEPQNNKESVCPSCQEDADIF